MKRLDLIFLYLMFTLICLAQDDTVPYPYFSEGLASVSDSIGKYGFIDETGKIIIPFKYDFAFSFDNGFAEVCIRENESYRCGMINKKGEEVVPLKYDDIGGVFFEGLVSVKLNDKYGFVDTMGVEVIPLKYDLTVVFNEGLAPVKLNGKSGFINKKGKIIIPLMYDEADFFQEGLAPVKFNGKWGFINKKGKIIIPFKYDGVNWGWFSSKIEKIIVSLNGKVIGVDMQGNEYEIVKEKEDIKYP
jgi:hypothetical protein